LSRRAADALDAATRLIEEQLLYAEQSGESDYAVKTLCNFANAVYPWDATQALAWLEKARELAPWNPYPWTIRTKVLRSVGWLSEALSSTLESVRRFPDDVVARTGLGEVLRQANRLEEAEAVYRETVARFPDDVFARTGLTAVLRQRRKLDEVIAPCEETILSFPADRGARRELSESISEPGRTEEAGRVAREPVCPPVDEAGRPMLRPTPAAPESFPGHDLQQPQQPLEPQGTSPPELAQSRRASSAEPRARLRPQDLQVLLNDACLLRIWGRARGWESMPRIREESARLAKRLEEAASSAAEAASELGLLELDRAELEQAIDFLRVAARRFPGSVRVRYALARAEREQARRLRLRLNDPDSLRVIRAWDDLRLPDRRLTPVSHLGSGRAWLALMDGNQVEENARESFGKLAHAIRKILEAGVAANLSRWAQDLNQFVFAGETVRRADEIGSMEAIRECVEQHSAVLNSMEEELVSRFCLV